MDAVVEIKKSLILDYYNYINRLEFGDYTVDTTKMYAKILFVESAFSLDKFQFIYEKLI